MLLNKFCYRKYKLFDKISFLKDVSNIPEKKNKKQKKLKKTNKQTNKQKKTTTTQNEKISFKSNKTSVTS